MHFENHVTKKGGSEKCSGENFSSISVFTLELWQFMFRIDLYTHIFHRNNGTVVIFEFFSITFFFVYEYATNTRSVLHDYCICSHNLIFDFNKNNMHYV